MPLTRRGSACETPAAPALPDRARHRRRECKRSIAPPALQVCAATVLGGVKINSAKSAGSAMTSILPPCCFTMMSWPIEKPGPAPAGEHLLLSFGWYGGAIVADASRADEVIE